MMTPCNACSRSAECGHEPPAPDRCPDYQPLKPSPFRLIRADQMTIRPTSWIVRGLLEADSFAVWYGKFGTLKSFAALDVSFATVTRLPSIGHSVVLGGPVVYLAGEGHSGLARRLRAWEIARGTSLKGKPLFFSAHAANLSDGELIAALRAAVSECAAVYGPPRLIVVDTWSRNLGADENSSLDSAAAVAALDSIRKPYGASCLVVHHSGWDGSRTRGSTVLMSAADSAFRFDRAVDGVTTMTCEKMKDGAPPEPIAFDLEDVPLPGVLDDEGREAKSAATRYLPDHVSKPAAAPTGKNQAAALQILNDALDANRFNLQSRGLDPSGAGVSLAQWKERMKAAGIQPKRQGEVISSLTSSGIIAIEPGGLVHRVNDERERSDSPF